MWRHAACRKNKKVNRRKRAGMIPYHAGHHMERVHLDVLGPFNMSSKVNRYVPGMIDQLTKWLECVPLPDQSTEKLIDLLSMIFSSLACPLLFTAIKVVTLLEMYKSVCKLLDIRKIQTMPYHPESNGQIECYNCTIVEMIRCLKLKLENDWDIYLPQIKSASRCLENLSTGFIANRLMLVREVHKPVHNYFDLMPEKFENIGDCERKFGEVFRETHPIAKNQQL